MTSKQLMVVYLGRIATEKWQLLDWAEMTFNWQNELSSGTDSSGEDAYADFLAASKLFDVGLQSLERLHKDIVDMRDVYNSTLARGTADLAKGEKLEPPGKQKYQW